MNDTDRDLSVIRGLRVTSRLLSPAAAAIAIIAFARGRIPGAAVMLALAALPWGASGGARPTTTHRRAVTSAVVVGVTGIVVIALGVAGRLGGSRYPGLLAIAAGLFSLWAATRRPPGTRRAPPD